MKKFKVFVSTYPFGLHDITPRTILENSGIEVLYNPYNRKLKPFETAEFAKDVDGIIAGTENLNELIQINTNLKFISRVGIGLDSVPLKLCREKNIPVSYTPDAVTMAVAELTIGLMISTTRSVHIADREIRNGKWTRFTGIRLGESNIGVIGAGRVGSNVIRLLSEFKPKNIFIHDIIDKKNEIRSILENKNINYSFVGKDDVLNMSNIVTLHIPLNKRNKDFIKKEDFQKMQKDSFLINTSRGGIVNEEDLYIALKESVISGAAIDVFENEPYHGKLKDLQNILLTEHMGSCSFDCRLKMETEAAEEIVRFINGKEQKSPVPTEEYDID
ncbi:MAG: phosphoglycerate dehydrogenase [Leptospiraceae bacterium]|nr:phosphoglycerate dehydrogenase [Leptospiraceae bacterium]